MIKTNKIFFYLFFAMFCLISKAWSFPVPTFSFAETAEAITTHISTASSTASEITSTKDLIKKGVLAGIPGYLKAIESGDWNGLVKGVASDGYKLYQADRKLKKEAKEKAQEEASKGAKQKAEDMKEGTKAAEKAVEENRDKAAKNKESKIKKALAWGKKQGASAGNWLNSGKNRQGMDKITHGLLGDSQASSAMNKAMDALSKQGENGDN